MRSPLKPSIEALEANKHESTPQYREALDSNPLSSSPREADAATADATRACIEELSTVAQAFEEVLTEKTLDAEPSIAAAARRSLEDSRQFLVSNDAVLTFMTDPDGRIAVLVTGPSGDARRCGYRLGLANRPNDPSSVADMIAARCHAYARALHASDTCFTMSRDDIAAASSDSKLEIATGTHASVTMHPSRPIDRGHSDA